MILHIKPQSNIDLTTIGSKLLGKTVYVNWPHLKEGLVIGVSESNRKMNSVNQFDNINETEWNVWKKRITEM